MEGTPARGEIVGVKGTGRELRVSPDAKAPLVINEKATRIIGSKQYHTIDSSTPVQVQCEKGDWVRVQLTQPEWLRDVTGWTKRGYLLLPSESGESRTFTEEDFTWEKRTIPYKKAIIEAVNRIHRDDVRCKDEIDPGTMSYSPSKSTPRRPVFFITCGYNSNAVNVFFTPDDAVSGKKFTAPTHINQQRAVDLCEAYAKQQSAHPSTVSFSRLMNLAINEYPNGRTAVTSKFTAKNSLNLELTFDIRCMADQSGFIEGTISEAK